MHGLTTIHRTIFALLTAALILATWPASTSHAQETGPDTPPAFTYQECRDVEEQRLRDELNDLTQQTFAEERQSLDFDAIVARHWTDLAMDATVDQAIDDAVARAYEEESYWQRFLSGWSARKAEELTEEIATAAFSSSSFRDKTETLSAEIAEDVARQMTTVSAESASSALLCIQAFIGDSYSDTMASLFEEEIAAQVQELDLSDVEAGVLPLLQSHTRTLAGVGVIIGTQVARRLAQRLAQRIAGRVVGRILGRAASSVIPLVGWVIGGGLIVWDIIEGGQGALPQIQSALKEESIKEEVRTEIAASVDEELQAELPAMARTVANEMHSQWLDFRRKYTRVLSLAEGNDRFRELVDTASASDVDRLSTLVVVAEQALGQEGLQAAIDRGHLEQLFHLPPDAYQILRASADPEVVLDWANLAGADLEQVLTTDLYRVASPGDFVDRQALAAVLALQEPQTITEVMRLDPEQRTALLTLPQASVVQLSDVYSADELRWLARYVARLDPRQDNLLVEHLLADRDLMQKLQSETVHESVVTSPNPEETLEFLVNPAPSTLTARSPGVPLGRGVGQVVEDAERLIEGEVTWLLWWRKYGTWRNGLFVLAALSALLVAGWLLWRRGQPVQVTVNVPDRE